MQAEERRGNAGGTPSQSEFTMMCDGRVTMEMRVRRTTGCDRWRLEVLYRQQGTLLK